MSKNRPTQIYIPLIFNKEAKVTQWGKTVFSTNGAEQQDIHMEMLDLYLTPKN